MANSTSFGTFIKNAPAPVKKQVFILLLLGFFFVGGALGTVMWILKVHKGSSAPEAVLEKSRNLGSHEDTAFKYAYEIKDMSMALLNKKGNRTAYAQFTLIFDCPEESCKKLMELNRAKIINGIFEASGGFYVEDFEAPIAAKGFQRFKNEIHTKTKEYFGSKAPSLVVLRDWVMN